MTPRCRDCGNFAVAVAYLAGKRLGPVCEAGAALLRQSDAEIRYYPKAPKAKAAAHA